MVWDWIKAVEWPVLVTIASAFGVGTALETTGAASALAECVFGSIRNLGPTLALAVIYFLVSLMTELITNNAAAILMFPICLKTAALYDADPRAFVIGLVLAASASFMTPIGYQTNMMVYGPGGYYFSDFLKVGAPLNLVLGVVAVVVLPWLWPF